jgi:hypothetical protein
MGDRTGREGLKDSHAIRIDDLDLLDRCRIEQGQGDRLSEFSLQDDVLIDVRSRP